MGQINFMNLLIKNAANLLQSTLDESLNQSITYKELAQKEDIAEYAFINMIADLTKEQKSIIDNLIDKRDHLNAEYSTMAYIQGYIDCIRMLKALQPEIYKD
ncbi:hypothetical protein QA584_10385 [Anaerocolumna sp. AGMB13025]|uniref:hypothetical protein n=1 Tax=Anaerocolumna sp. AGMB13025 TaxID=3039116 RepID=UPI00241C67F6|nr:hypothetical protein [Anaerocolumna sp. AGMB13025]WFR59471.1 hypothetical protein QA584_10385 [Anaerocolumna sp. AGMB13025]